MATGIVYKSNSKNSTEISLIENLLGHKIIRLCGNVDTTYIITENIVYDVNNQKEVPELRESIEIKSGRSHQVMRTRSGQLYTWGVGEYGELGLGGKISCVNLPTQIPHQKKFIQIDCGLYHSVALDEDSNLYTWGQNFDKQLACYNKSSSQLPPNTIVEQVIMQPKCSPFSLNKPMLMVTCGSTFTVAVTKTGECWTWGAGESGQLGTGRCTHRDIPQQVVFQTDHGKDAGGIDNLIISAAAGFGHVLALTKTGRVYTWGLNAKGECGVGDVKVRHHPVDIGVENVSKIYANTYSSALLNHKSELYTWGSNKYNRLLHDDNDQIVLYPKQVTIVGTNIDDFSFSSTHSCILIFTRLHQGFPEAGPQKTFTHFELHGCGFWNSETIIVKFLKRGGSSDRPSIPRSSPGVFKDGIITCRPPKLTDAGLYDVSLAMNGRDFCSTTITVDIYPDPVVIKMIEPQVYDIKKNDGHLNVALQCTKLPASAKSIYVKIFDAADLSRPAIITEGTVFDMIDDVTSVKTDDIEDADERNVSAGNSQYSNQQHPPQEVTELDQIRMVRCHEVDVTKLLEDAEFTILKTEISRNGRDFSEPSTEKIVCHQFHAAELFPSCCPFSGQRELTVVGTGILPTDQVDYEAILEIRVQPEIKKVLTSKGKTMSKLDGTESVDSSESASVKENVYQVAAPVRSLSGGELSITVPAIQDFFPSKEAIPQNVNLFKASIHFHMKGGIPLFEEDNFQLFYYANKPIKVSPKVLRRSGGTDLTITSPSLLFKASEAKLNFVANEEGIIIQTDCNFLPADDNGGNGGNGLYKIKCVSPAFVNEDEEVDTATGAAVGKVLHHVSKGYVGLLLDGISVPDDKEMVEVTIFDAVVCGEVQVPKGGFVLNTVVTVPAKGLVQSDICRVRISGNDESKFLEVKGSMDESLQSFSFTLPESMTGANVSPASVSGKLASYYCSVTIDGSTFDRSKDPFLTIKQ